MEMFLVTKVEKIQNTSNFKTKLINCLMLDLRFFFQMIVELQVKKELNFELINYLLTYPVCATIYDTQVTSFNSFRFMKW
jgi:hypothetical protein